MQGNAKLGAGLRKLSPHEASCFTARTPSSTLAMKSSMPAGGFMSGIGTLKGVGGRGVGDYTSLNGPYKGPYDSGFRRNMGDPQIMRTVVQVCRLQHQG